MNERYEVVFDVCAVGYRHWGDLATGGAVTALFILIAKFQERWPLDLFGRPWRSSPRWGWRFAAVFTGMVGLATTYDYLNVCGRLRGGQALLVEGPVHDFRLEYDKAQSESFFVNARRYTYYAHDGQAGFDTPMLEGGPIRDGLRVRIHEVDGQIARLEVLR